ncbi:glycosyltransferase family 39 protein [Galbibacter sp.]|uniref:glycosyltransferase family 39 protein n=1 Tax=Galbibacter sp. TaxID=2918471 RepID=UPI003A8EE50C
MNLVQSAFTDIIFDEAYYWYFAQNLSWGYFDHPPMVAFLVKIGISLFDGVLGVRFMAPLLYCANVLLLWLLIDSEKKHRYIWLFLAFVSSVGLLTAYGFMMVPDTSLVTFGLVFLWGYKRFLLKEDALSIVVTGIGMALVMYAKYNGVLIVGFAVLSNLALLKNGKFWLAILIGLLLFLPHLNWLYEMDFKPIRYHLFDRANSPWRLKNTLNYPLNVVAVAGLCFPLMYWALYALSSKDKFDKALKFICYGTLLFFLISSFDRKTQAQWVVLTAIPLIVFSLRYAYVHAKFRKWLMGISLASIVIITFLRFALIFPSISPIKYEAFGNKEWVAELKSHVGDLPVVFHNSYRDASMYAFYSGSTVFSSNDIIARQNQYDIDSSEFEVRNKKVAYISGSKPYKLDSVIRLVRPFRNHYMRGHIIDTFTSYRKMQLDIDKDLFNAQIPNEFKAVLLNPYEDSVDVSKLVFEGVSMDSYKAVIKTFPLLTTVPKNSNLSPLQTMELHFKIPDTVQLPESSYFRAGILEYGLHPGFQGEMIKIAE